MGGGLEVRAAFDREAGGAEGACLPAGRVVGDEFAERLLLGLLFQRRSRYDD